MFVSAVRSNIMFLMKFSTAHMNKDVQLYLEGTQAAQIQVRLGAEVAALWKGMDGEMAGSDITEIFNYVQAHLK